MGYRLRRKKSKNVQEEIQKESKKDPRSSIKQIEENKIGKDYWASAR
jgi:hypothetical protein